MATLGLTVFFAVVVAISALCGLVRGLNKSVIRIITLALAVILTFVIAAPVTTAIMDHIQIDGMSLGELILEGIASSDAIYDIMEAVPAIREMVLVLPAFAASFLVFPLVFWVLKFITWIIFACVQKPLRKLIFKEKFDTEEAQTASTGVRVAKRFGGLGVGIVTGIVIFAMIVTPFFGVFSMLPSSDSMGQVMDIMVEQEVLSAEDVDMIRQIYGVTDCTIVRLYGAVGVSSAGKAYLNSVSKFEVDGQTFYLAEELDAVLNMLQTAMDSKLMDLLAATDDEEALLALLADKAFVDSLMNSVFQSKIISNAVPELVATAMQGMASSMAVPANKQEVYNNMMENVAAAVRDSDVDFVGIHAYEQANNVAASYVRSAPYKTFSPEEIMTEEEYEMEVRKLVELTQQISKALDRALSGDNAAFADSVASCIVDQVKTQAAENGEETLGSFDASGVQSAISSIDASAIEADNAGALLEQLTDQDKFETDVATMDTIVETIRETVKNAFADETKAAEAASTLASVVTNLADAVSGAMDADGNLDAGKLDFEKVASAVTSLQNSNLKGVGSSLLDMVASGDLGDSGMVSDMMGAVKEGYDNGEDVGSTINAAGALLGLGSAMSGEGESNQEAVVNSLASLINNLNDFTIGLLPSILSADTFSSMGVPAEYAQATYDVIETLLKELMKQKGAENYDNEVKAILSLYTLLTNGVEQFAGENIADLAGSARESEAVFNTLISISVSNPFGIEIGDEAVRAELIQTIENEYAQSSKTDKEHSIYGAIATLLGLDAEVNLG